ncbi:uncharacterized protein LOC131315036 [Rhododendron vialii]|uniref:uncharacterized protein LOC131315036 n=1 Tax=Rhododendron vialii TaxID=182163 RepID=UPI0026603004|nr:uncharacterized protein LOC131315036 [Rhododendron vialii]
MESRLAATARVNFRLLSGVSRHQSLCRGLATVPLPTRRVADPAIHGESPSESDTLVTARAAATAEKKETEHKPTKDLDPLMPPKPPYAPSPKLESPAVTPPIDPIPQQKRRHTTVKNRAAIDNVSCAALDDGPWPDDGGESRRQLRTEQEEDYKEYYDHHKASPLSEIEVADTRKPITRATDGTADSYVGEILDVVLWREEQLDTAEEALRRAMEIWKQSATRGDPDSPHGRVLRALRRENW